MKSVTIHGIIGTIIVVAIAIISNRLYRHKGRAYAQGKSQSIPAMPGFIAAYRWVQFSTVVVSVVSFLTDSPAALKVFHTTSLIYVGLSIAGLALALSV